MVNFVAPFADVGAEVHKWWVLGAHLLTPIRTVTPDGQKHFLSVITC